MSRSVLMLCIAAVLSRAASGQVFSESDVIAVTASATLRLAVGDLDADGLCDIVTADDDLLVTRLGLPGPAFAPEHTQPLPITQVRDLELADLDLDGVLDLAMTHKGGVTTLLGDGSGRFVVADARTIGVFKGVGVVAAELTGDGLPDLVVSSVSGSKFFCCSFVDLLPGIGDGTVGEPIDLFYKEQVGPPGMLVDDVTKDGVPDVVMATEDLWIAKNQGGSAFDTVLGEEGLYAFSKLAGGDLNGDGHADLVFPRSDHFGIVLTHPSGRFQPAQYEPNDSASPAGAFLVADFNADGARDILSTNPADNDVSLRPGKGDGTFRRPERTPTLGRTPTEAAAADLDEDGRLDALVVNAPSGFLSLLLQR